MRSSIMFLLLVLLTASCAGPGLESPTWPAAARLPTVQSTPTPTSAARKATTPTEVPPTFYYTPPPVLPTSTPSGSPTPTSIPGPEDYQISILDMVDDQVGWGVFTLNGMKNTKEIWLGYSSDGGHTWLNITPPSFEYFRSTPSYASFRGYLSLHALDVNTAWAFPSCSPSSEQCDLPAVIWRTEDAGRTWVTFLAPADCQEWRIDCIPASFQATDPLHGWLMMRRHGRNYIAYAFYRTRDGGATYEKLPLPGPEGAIDTGLVNYPIFISETFGLQLPQGLLLDPIVEIQAGRFPRMRMTRDGGRTWQLKILPQPAGFLETLQAIPQADRKFITFNSEYLGDEQLSRVLIFLVDFDTIRTRSFFHVFYFSTDQGSTWQALSQVGDTFMDDTDNRWRMASMFPPGLEQTADGGLTWRPLPFEWWEGDFDQRASYVTHFTDGGAEQTEVKTRFLDERFWPGRGVRLETLQMRTALEGWGVEAGGETLCTEDGALTWLPCHPPDQTAIPSRSDLPETEGNWLPGEPLPEELFHGGPFPSQMQGEIDRSRQFVSEVDPRFSYSPFRYRCTSVGMNRMSGDKVSAARKCTITYPISLHPDFGFTEAYWIYRYYVTFEDGESLIWPNVVSMDLIDGETGWRLLDLLNGLYRIEATSDGGRSWSMVKVVAWTGQLDFVSAQEGWAIALQPPKRGVPDYLYLEDLFRPAALLHTLDGGRTWEEIQAVIGP